MAKKQIGSNATFSGSQKGLTTIGSEHAYAFSGIVACDDTATTLLDLSTGKYFIVAHLDFGTGSVSSRDMKWRLSLNGEEVYSYVSSGTNQAGANPQNHIQMLIPPLTTLLVTSENESDNNSENQSIVLTGRVYR